MLRAAREGTERRRTEQNARNKTHDAKTDGEKAKVECTAQDKKGVTGANVIAEWIALILGRERRSLVSREPGG